MQSEGVLRLLWGWLRPGIVVFGLIGIIIDPPRALWYVSGALGVLSILTLVRLGLKKQPLPVWTQKAILMVSCSLFITLTVATLISAYSPIAHPLVILLPILQPFILALSWLLLQPLDYTLKKRILDRALRLRSNYSDMIVIGITGSVGKTTTKELVAHVLQDFNPLVTPAHINTEIGISKWMQSTWPGALKKKNETKPIAIIEMGAYRLGEIALLCRITQPTIGLITYLGKQHIALFGSQENLCNAKGELFDALPQNGTAILNADSPVCDSLKTKACCPLITVGTGDGSDIEAIDIEETSQGISCTIDGTVFDVPIHGTHNVSNVLLAIATGRQLGMSDTTIAKKLASFSLPHQTFTVESRGSVTVLNDTHNSSEASFLAATDWAKSQPFDSKTLLFSGLIELGAQHDSVHQKLGIACRGVFERVLSTNARSAAAFEKGYGNKVEIVSKNTKTIAKDSLLVCEGRIRESTIGVLLQNL